MFRDTYGHPMHGRQRCTFYKSVASTTKGRRHLPGRDCDVMSRLILSALTSSRVLPTDLIETRPSTSNKHGLGRSECSSYKSSAEKAAVQVCHSELSAIGSDAHAFVCIGTDTAAVCRLRIFRPPRHGAGGSGRLPRIVAARSIGNGAGPVGAGRIAFEASS